MSFITPWKARDMWLRERSVKTTEYSRRPSGSTSGSRPGMVSSRTGISKVRSQSSLTFRGLPPLYAAPSNGSIARSKAGSA